MGDIHAVNAHALVGNEIFLMDIERECLIEEFFHVIAKGEEEWYLLIDESTMDHYRHIDNKSLQFTTEKETAEALDDNINFITKTFGLSRDDVLGLIWVW